MHIHTYMQVLLAQVGIVFYTFGHYSMTMQCIMHSSYLMDIAVVVMPCSCRSQDATASKELMQDIIQPSVHYVGIIEESPFCISCKLHGGESLLCDCI